MLKATVLGVALLAGATFAAQAQSVSSLAPNGAPAASAPAAVAPSASDMGPTPGGSAHWKDTHYQDSANAANADRASNMADHPYSMSIDGAKSGPKPN